MKICPRYPFPKSLSSGKGFSLAFGSNIFSFYIISLIQVGQVTGLQISVNLGYYTIFCRLHFIL